LLIEIIGTENCVWCNRAKEYLDAKGLEYTYSNLELNDPEAATTKIFLANGFRSVPQIWVNGTHIGGYEKTIKFLEETLVEH
jgi:glutaredoxin 3